MPVNQVMLVSVQSDDFNLTNRNPWFSSFLLVATLYQGNPDRNHKLWNIASTKRYILHMQVLLECCYMEILKSSLLSQSFGLNPPSLSISRCRSRYVADLSVYVVSFISSSMGYMRSTKSPNLELFSESTHDY